MANLYNTRVYGSIIVDTAITSGCGFQNMVVLTTGSSATYNFPSVLQDAAGAKFKVTIIGGGGGGSGSGSGGIAASCGGSGAVVIAIITIIAGINSFTYNVGAGGAAGLFIGNPPTTARDGGASSILYNGINYTAGGGVGGYGGNVTNGNGVLNIPGGAGAYGGGYTTTYFGDSRGGSTPLGFGSGGVPLAQATGYGSGGSGAIAQASGIDGQPGLIILEY